MQLAVVSCCRIINDSACHSQAALSEEILALMDAANSVQYASPSQGVWTVGNICALVTGTPESKRQANGQVIQFFLPSAFLENEEKCLAYMASVTSELSRAAKSEGNAELIPEDFHEAMRDLTMFSDRTHLLQLMNAVDGGSNDYGVLCGLYSILLHR